MTAQALLLKRDFVETGYDEVMKREKTDVLEALKKEPESRTPADLEMIQEYLKTVDQFKTFFD